jgi:hypothetical protein
MKITIVLGQLGILSCSKALTLIIVLIKKSPAFFSMLAERKYTV